MLPHLPSQQYHVKAYARALADYAIADLKYPNRSSELLRAANNVLIAIPGGYISVEALVKALGKNSWLGSVYEAWNWEVCRAVLSCRSHLHSLEFAALLEVASHLYDFTITWQDASDALREARDALYGDNNDDDEWDDDD